MYNTLINALGKAGQIEEVNKPFEQMKTSGINPDIVTFNTLIEVHSKAGRLKDAYKFLKMMLDASSLPNHLQTRTTKKFLFGHLQLAKWMGAIHVANMSPRVNGNVGSVWQIMLL
jgi:pentatricopeptide repeat protein